MADVELVIKIPQEIYEDIKQSNTIFRDDERTCYEVVKDGTPLEQRLNKAYEDFGELKAGDSYIIIHGKKVSTDTAYAMQGIELFIDFVTGKAEHKTYDE